MTLTTDQYDAAYFGDTEESGGLKHDAGYSNYLEQVGGKYRFDSNNPARKYNPFSEKFKKFLELEGLEDASVLELGGATGHFAEWALEENMDWTVIEVSDWCRRHKVIPDQNFILNDALTYLQTLSNNSIDVIVSNAFLVCLDDSQLVTLIAEMRRVARVKQIHFINEKPNPLFYTVKTLEQWESQFNWANNKTVLISLEDEDIIRT